MAQRRTAAVTATGLLLGAGTLLAACGSSGTPTASGQGTGGCPSGVATVTAHGHGSVAGPPDLLTISLGVQTQAPTASAALDDNSTKATALVNQLKKDQVADQDLQTSGLSIQPVYSNGPSPVITAYQVTNTVTAKLRNLSGAGALIDGAAQAVGNDIRVDQLGFSIQDDSTLAGQARGAAVRQAETQARAMASAAGHKLGPLCSVTDNSASAAPQPLGQTLAASGAGAALPPVETGSQQVTADVTAVYQLGG